MSVIVEITDRTPDGRKKLVVGRFVLEEGKITSKPEHGQERYMDRLLADPVTVPKTFESVTATGNPESWIKALPSNYCGSRTRASIVVEKQNVEHLHERADKMLRKLS